MKGFENMKKFIVDDSFWNLLPDINIAVLVLKNVNERKTLDSNEAKEIEKLLEGANEIAKKYLTSDVISENEVVKRWRETYQKFPTKKGARCSIEALLKRVLHDKPVTSILPSVDITNSISLKYAFPIGAEDLDKIKGDLHLGAMQGGEEFYPIGDDKMDPPLSGEVAYYDEKGAVCRCFNWRDGKRTQISDDTTTEFIAMECVEPERIEELVEALNELSELMKKYLDCEIVVKEIVNKDNKELVLE